MRMRTLLGVGIAAVVVFWVYLGGSSLYRAFVPSRPAPILAMVNEQPETATPAPPTPTSEPPTAAPSPVPATEALATPQPEVRPTLTLPLADTPLPIATVQAFRTLLAGPHATATPILSLSDLLTASPVAQGTMPPAETGTDGPARATVSASQQPVQATATERPGQVAPTATSVVTPPFGPATPSSAISTVLPTEAAPQASEALQASATVSPVETATMVPGVASGEGDTLQPAETAMPRSTAAPQPEQPSATTESAVGVADEATVLPAEVAPVAGEPPVASDGLAVQPAETVESAPSFGAATSEDTGSVSTGTPATESAATGTAAAAPTLSALVGSSWNDHSISGLTAADLKTRLKKGYGLTCSAPAKEGGLLVWRCAVPGGKSRFSAVITGIDASRIVSVAGTVTGTSRQGDKAAASYLGFIAGQPYRSSAPAQARTWVQQHLTAGGQTSIGGVNLGLSTAGAVLTFELFAPGTARGKG